MQGERRTESLSIDGPIILRMFKTSSMLPAKTNHKLFYAINNPCNHQAISYFNFGRVGNNPLTAAAVVF